MKWKDKKSLGENRGGLSARLTFTLKNRLLFLFNDSNSEIEVNIK